MHANVSFALKVALAYGAVCKPLCRELGLTQTAFDILLFLANNPSYRTARDIVEVRHIKANLVSVNVDKLVQEGYLTRQPVAGDRRKTALACTPRARRSSAADGSCKQRSSTACSAAWSRRCGRRSLTPSDY